MSCLRPDRMDLYLEDELSGAERAEFERHLAACPACRLEFEDRRLLGLALTELPPIEVPESFVEAVMARLPRAPRRGISRVLAPVTATAAVLAAFLGYHLATGESLIDLLGAAGRAIASFVGLAVPLGAKVFMALRILLELVKTLGTALLRGLGILAPFLRPEVISIAFVLGLALFAVVVLGLKKIVSLGERP
jgi:predicted anti-sigma-YlaC factor YlaD